MTQEKTNAELDQERIDRDTAASLDRLAETRALLARSRARRGLPVAPEKDKSK